MSAQADEDLSELMTDELAEAPKPVARPLVRSAKQKAAAQRAAQKRELALAQTAAQQQAARLAQIVNLHIAGFSLTAIGAQIGATADEVDRMLSTDAARYVKTQPALRVYVRNFISEKYSGLLEAVWDEATDKKHPEKLENQDRALRILKEMARLHGAEAPTQAEVKVESAPENVEKMVAVLAAAQGAAYDATIFDTVPGEVVHGMTTQAHDATVVSGNRIGLPDESDEDFGA